MISLKLHSVTVNHYAITNVYANPKGYINITKTWQRLCVVTVYSPTFFYVFIGLAACVARRIETAHTEVDVDSIQTGMINLLTHGGLLPHISVTKLGYRWFT